MHNTPATNYVAGKALEAAVDVALDLEMPLLLTGEPGTGKTLLAYWIAEQKISGGVGKVLRFNTKSNSAARDLFYRYDAIRHFRDAQNKQNRDKYINPLDYINFEALGKAILAQNKEVFVVLVDEVDKAPRDFPNDILFEFEELAFRVEEATMQDFQAANAIPGYWEKRTDLKGLGIQELIPEDGFIRWKGKTRKPVLILTSNSEKNLPDAFLRRCVYHHIEFDNMDLAAIIRAHFPDKYDEDSLKKIADFFKNIRSKGIRKPPATAELVRWVELLQKKKLDINNIVNAEAKSASDRSNQEKDLLEVLTITYAVLAKNKDDVEKLKR